MLKSCKYCGRIHDSMVDCGRRPTKKKKYDDNVTFRNTSVWRKKRQGIQDRDGRVCQVCLAKHKVTTENLSVHHIVPLTEDYSRREDDTNLITVCSFHHEQAESNKISRKYLFDLVSDSIQRRNNSKY